MREMTQEIWDSYPRLGAAMMVVWGDGGFTAISPMSPRNLGPRIAI